MIALHNAKHSQTPTGRAAFARAVAMPLHGLKAGYLFLERDWISPNPGEGSTAT